MPSSDAPLLRALHQVPALVAVLRGPDLVYEYVNAAYAEQVPLESPIGKPFGSSTHDRSSEMRHMIEKVFATGEPVSFRESRLGGDSQMFYDIRCVALRDASGAIDGVMIHSVDVTDLVHERRRKEAVEKQLLHVQKLESLGVLAGGIAHDFNNLLTIVLGNVSTAVTQLPKGHVALDPLHEATMAITRAAELTHQLLAYAGKGRFRVEPIDVSEQVRRVAALLRASVPKSVELALDLDPSLPEIEADVSQLHQIVMNLVTNGAEAIDAPRGVVSVATRTIDVGAERLIPPGPYVVLEVTDSGRGMDEATRQRIFDPFFTTKFTGRGLGLASVLGIIRTHKGDIEVESSPGQGTTFRALFPVTKAHAKRPVDAPHGAIAGQGLVLVIDDDENVRRTTARLIATQGFEVVEAPGGKEGLELFAAHPSAFTAVVVDMTMPGMNGRECFHALRGVRADVPIIVTSGYDESDARWLATGPTTTFLAKPFTVEQLAQSFRDVLVT